MNKQESILFSCVYNKINDSEQIIKKHCLVYVVSGFLELMLDNKKFVLKTNSITLLKRNQLVKVVKTPNAKMGSFKSITVFFSQEILRSYYSHNEFHHYGTNEESVILPIERDDIFLGYFNSLLPYFGNPLKLNSKIVELKLMEAIELLKGFEFSKVLFDFREPYKIDIGYFMNKNFHFNVPISEFARLTGRSLSSFKRDFKLKFNNTPQRWLTSKRLEKAHFLITKQGRRPSEIYYEIGFENFSHFSKVYNDKYGSK